MGKEVEMRDAEDKGKEAEAPAPAVEALKPLQVLRSNVHLIEKAVAQKETRTLFGRLLRQTAAVRKQLTAHDLQAFLAEALPPASPAAAALAEALKQVDAAAMDADDGAAAANGSAAADAAASAPLPAPSSLPEVELYGYLLTLMVLIDNKQYEQAQAVAAAAVERLGAFNRRTLDVIAARIYAYLSLAHERTGSLAAIRSALLGLHRTAVLRHDDVGAETLLNLLLRNYLHYNLYDQAERLRAKAQRPSETGGRSYMQQQCRHLYYLGRIRAVQLEYSEAKDCLQQAARKAPTSAVGFRVCVHKWLVLVRLLLGEVPDRTEFTAPDMAGPLAPYFDLTQAVRSGDLTAFSAVASAHDAVFCADAVHHLIVRLRHNVIRAGLRRMSLAYSRISLADVAAKLGLASVQDTESIVAKAIRDGGIEGVLNHEASTLESARAADVYATDQPQAAFHARIAFCMDVHNEAVKAMRYGEGGAVKEFEDATALRERQEQELQAALEEEDEGDF